MDNYFQNYQQNYTQNYQTPQVKDEGNSLLAALSFFFPVAGLIIYLVEKDEKPKTAKQSGKWAIYGVIASVVFSIIITIFTILMTFGIIGATFNIIEDAQDEDVISSFQYESAPLSIEGNSFYDTDKSKIIFNNDGTFVWYQDENITDDNYYKGTYTVKYGADAENYLKNTNFPKTPLDFSKMDNIYGKKDYYTKDNLIAFELKHTDAVANGKNMLEDADTNITYYFGFVSDEDGYKIDVVHIATGGYHTFTLIDNFTKI